jgi:hypothetical protein
MARGSFWDEPGRDRDRRRRAEVARLRAEAQIRKDERRAAAGSRRDEAARQREERETEAQERQAELDARMAELTGRDVQALMGAMAEHPTATNGLLVTTSRFSDRTRQRARAQGIGTMEGAELGLEIREHLGLDVVNSARTR